MEGEIEGTEAVFEGIPLPTIHIHLLTCPRYVLCRTEIRKSLSSMVFQSGQFVDPPTQGVSPEYDLYPGLRQGEKETDTSLGPQRSDVTPLVSYPAGKPLPSEGDGERERERESERGKELEGGKEDIE